MLREEAHGVTREVTDDVEQGRRGARKEGGCRTMRGEVGRLVVEGTNDELGAGDGVACIRLGDDRAREKGYYVSLVSLASLNRVLLVEFN